MFLMVLPVKDGINYFSTSYIQDGFRKLIDIGGYTIVLASFVHLTLPGRLILSF